MDKTYYEFMHEISAEELYEGLLGYGLFSTSLPPIFESKSFFDYCNDNKTTFSRKESHDNVSFLAMRNVNVPRPISIPTPMSYQILCSEIKDNWDKLINLFYENTVSQTYRISRIHLRKRYNTRLSSFEKSLFEMNYKNFHTDGNPDDDLLITLFNDELKACKYLVKADISSCFPSVYTHSISWALVGKEHAKQNRDEKLWFNKLDKCCRQTNNGETHGLLIGPHTSNLLVELILTSVDKALYNSGFRFIRNIDDYSCFVPDYETAQVFLRNLEIQLSHFDLMLNHKKTSIEPLPTAKTEHWIRRLNAMQLSTTEGQIRFPEVNNYIDQAIRLAEEYGNDAILKYSLKVLSRNNNYTNNAKHSIIKRFLHLALLHPYLIKLLDDYLFAPFKVDVANIKLFSDALYASSLSRNNYEGLAYSFMYAIKYGFQLEGYTFSSIEAVNDCISYLLAYLYCEKYQLKQDIDKFHNIALDLQNNQDFDQYWVFCYEVLNKDEIKSPEWKQLKTKGISFLTITKKDEDENE